MSRNVFITVALVAAIAGGFSFWLTRSYKQSRGVAVENSTHPGPSRQGFQAIESTNSLDTRLTNSGSSPAFASSKAIPDRVRRLIDRRKGEPRWALLKALEPEDKQTLLDLFRASPGKREQAVLAYGLAMIGDDQVASVLTNAVTEQVSAARATQAGFVTTSEGSAVLEIVSAMGILAHRSDVAYGFVKQGTEPLFWSPKGKPSSPFPIMLKFLLSGCMGSVASSGRSDAVQFLKRLDTRSLTAAVGGQPEEWDQFAAGCEGARFATDYIAAHGFEAYIELRLDCKEDLWGKFEAWRKSGRGNR